MKWLAGVVLASAATGAAAQASDVLTVHAAGSLRAALTKIAEDYATLQHLVDLGEHAVVRRWVLGKLPPHPRKPVGGRLVAGEE